MGERKIFPYSHADWHRWFAWRPVRRQHAAHPRIFGDWVWLRMVSRRTVVKAEPLSGVTYVWLYRT